MKITAFKDPVTGLLFEEKSKLTSFQSNRAKEEAAAKARKAAADALDRQRKTLVLKLTSKDKFVELASAMYTAVLDSAKTKRNKVPLKLVDIRIRNWRVSSSLRVTLDIEVELNGNPDTTYSDVFLRMTPPDVLYPFRLQGCGSAKQAKGSLTYCYSIQAELDDLPKLLAPMREAAKLQALSAGHKLAVDAESVAVQTQDPQLNKLKQASAKAQKAMLDVQELYAEAVGAQRKREAQLSAAVEERMPFEYQSQLSALEQSTGLAEVEAGYQQLSVRRALINSEIAAA